MTIGVGWERLIDENGIETYVPRATMVVQVFKYTATQDGLYIHSGGHFVASVVDPAEVERLLGLLSEPRRPLAVFQDVHIDPDETPRQMRQRIFDRLTEQVDGTFPFRLAVNDPEVSPRGERGEGSSDAQGDG